MPILFALTWLQHLLTPLSQTTESYDAAKRGSYFLVDFSHYLLIYIKVLTILHVLSPPCYSSYILRKVLRNFVVWNVICEWQYRFSSTQWKCKETYLAQTRDGWTLTFYKMVRKPSQVLHILNYCLDGSFNLYRLMHYITSE